MRALIGHTGFVGGNLKEQAPFDLFYRSTDIKEIAGKEFELIVSAGISSLKWKANQNPETDRGAIQNLMEPLKTVRAKLFILISSIDVYPNPVGVNEDTAVGDHTQPYGRHRCEFEKFIREKFPKTFVVRLPHLFGNGLKKNVVYDLLHQNRLDLIHQDATWQLYSLDHLWSDIQKALSNGLRLVNIAVEPVGTRELAREVFGVEFQNTLPPPALHFDFQTKYGRLWNKSGPYQYTKEESLRKLKEFVSRERARWVNSRS